MTPDELSGALSAALASAVAFTVGALLPLIAVVLAPAGMRVPVTFVAVVVALALTGSISARFGRAGRGPAVLLLILGGAAAMAITFGIGHLLGATVV